MDLQSLPENDVPLDALAFYTKSLPFRVIHVSYPIIYVKTEDPDFMEPLDRDESQFSFLYNPWMEVDLDKSVEELLKGLRLPDGMVHPFFNVVSQTSADIEQAIR
jgi:hypothetical protein